MLRETLDIVGILPGETFALAAILDRKIRPGCFANVGAAEAWLEQWTGWNLYFTGNAVMEGVTGRPKAAAITERRVLLVDIDPEKTAADPEGVHASGRSAALAVAAGIARLTGGVLVDSGRGHQVWVRVAADVDCQAFLAGIRAEFQGSGFKIDGTFDASRLMRLPGSVNTRTGGTVRVLDVGTGVRLSVADVETLGLKTPVAVVSVDVEAGAFGAPTAGDRAQLVGVLADIWAEGPGLDRSKRDFRFVLEGLRHGVDREALCRLLWALPGGKANTDGRGADYWESTLRSALTRREADFAQLDVLEGLKEKQKADPGWAFRPEVLEALALLRRTDLAGWHAVRGDLKPVGQIEKAMSGLDRRERRVEIAPDEKIRFMCRDGDSLGWVKFMRGAWTGIGRGDLSAWLTGVGLEASKEQARAIDRAYELCDVPFSPEYSGDRIWNRNGAQFSVEAEAGEHPTWNQILRVIGRGIDEDVQSDEWCQEAGIGSGGRYLFTWAAAMFQQPARPCPYLFLYSYEEGTGKSTLWEALELLMNRGCVAAKHALTSDFNGELSGAVLAVIDDFALPARKGKVHNKIKELVTATRFAINDKGLRVFMVDSYLHWIHTANNPGDCPVFDGDTRITVIPCSRAEGGDRAPKDEIMARLRVEAPAFLHSILGFEIPAARTGRLALPALHSGTKDLIAEANRDELERWVSDFPEWITMTAGEVQASFFESLSAGRHTFWPPHKVRQGLPLGGRRTRELALHLRALGDWSGTAEDLVGVAGFKTAQAVGVALTGLSQIRSNYLKVERAGRGLRGWAAKDVLCV